MRTEIDNPASQIKRTASILQTNYHYIADSDHFQRKDKLLDQLCFGFRYNSYSKFKQKCKSGYSIDKAEFFRKLSISIHHLSEKTDVDSDLIFSLIDAGNHLTNMTPEKALEFLKENISLSLSNYRKLI